MFHICYYLVDLKSIGINVHIKLNKEFRFEMYQIILLHNDSLSLAERDPIKGY